MGGKQGVRERRLRLIMRRPQERGSADVSSACFQQRPTSSKKLQQHRRDQRDLRELQHALEGGTLLWHPHDPTGIALPHAELRIANDALRAYPI